MFRLNSLEFSGMQFVFYFWLLCCLIGQSQGQTSKATTKPTIPDIYHPCRKKPCQNGAKCIELGNCTQEYRCVCPHGITGRHCETSVNILILNITAKESLSSVYIDGVEFQGLENANDWKKVSSIKVPLTSRLIAIIGVNIHDKCAGIMLSETHDYVISGPVNWKCNIDATHGWADLNYNDSSWPVAHVVGKNGVVPGCADMLEVKGIHKEAKWIWTTHNIQQDLVVYCRGYIDVCKTKPCQNGGTCHKSGPTLCSCIPGFSGQFCQQVDKTILSITANEKINELYIDGVRSSLTVIPADKVFKFQIDPTARQIAVMASDVHNPSTSRQCFGLLASSTGPISMLTSNAMWKCTSTPSTGWHQVAHDDSKWPRPESFQFNNQSRCPETKPVAGISQVARWIWTPSPTSPPQWDLIAFCRGYTNLCHKGIRICQNGGSCSSGLAAVCTCTKGFTGKFCELEIGVDVPGPEGVCPS